MRKTNYRLNGLEEMAKDDDVRVLSSYVGRKPDGESNFFCCDVAMFESRRHLAIDGRYKTSRYKI